MTLCHLANHCWKGMAPGGGEAVAKSRIKNAAYFLKANSQQALRGLYQSNGSPPTHLVVLHPATGRTVLPVHSNQEHSIRNGHSFWRVRYLPGVSGVPCLPLFVCIVEKRINPRDKARADQAMLNS